MSRPSSYRIASGLLAAALAAGCASDEDDPMDAGDDLAADDGAGDDGDDESEGAPADGGTIQMSFTLGGAAVGSTNLVDAPVGTVFGGIFRSADVGATGPREGAEQFAFVEAPGVDLSNGSASAVIWTSEPLPPDMYTFLGFFDVDGSSLDLEAKEPESGDPVTLPSVNKIEVEPGGPSELLVSFDLVLG